MWKLLVALTLTVAATASNAVTFEFDVAFRPTDPIVPAGLYDGKSGSATFTYDPDQSVAEFYGSNNMSETQTYRLPATLKLSLNGEVFQYNSLLNASVTIGRKGTIHDNVSFSSVGFLDNYSMYLGSTTTGGLQSLRLGDATEYVMSHRYPGMYFGAGGSSAVVSNFRELAAPVPEPGEWAMIGAGLAVVGGIARRRRTA